MGYDFGGFKSERSDGYSATTPPDIIGDGWWKWLLRIADWTRQRNVMDSQMNLIAEPQNRL